MGDLIGDPALSSPLDMNAIWSKIRRWIAITSGTALLSLFGCIVAGIGARIVLGLSENDALIFVGVPAAGLIAMWAWPRMGRVLGFDR
jgi:hypothetical protein